MEWEVDGTESSETIGDDLVHRLSSIEADNGRFISNSQKHNVQEEQDSFSLKVYVDCSLSKVL